MSDLYKELGSMFLPCVTAKTPTTPTQKTEESAWVHGGPLVGLDSTEKFTAIQKWLVEKKTPLWQVNYWKS